MPSKSFQMFAAWSNYNLTVGEPRAPFGTPGMTIENLYSLHCSDVDETRPLEAVAATGSVLLGYCAALETLRTKGSPAGFPPREFAAATVGQAWSFAPLVGTPVAQLLGAGLSWAGWVPPECVPACFGGAREHLMIAGGGTRLREMVTVAEASGRSIPTGGSHLGQSLAGSFGTGTHGSRLGRGGLQNMVRAMHIVTGPDSHVWLQPERAPVLTDEAIAGIVLTGPGGAPVPCTALTCDPDFDNALIHLGSMGIVNAVVVELVPREEFNVLAIDCPIDTAWLESIAASDFAGIGEQLGLCGTALQFYELTVDPHAPFGDHAAHIVYTLRESEQAEAGPLGTRPATCDLIGDLTGAGAPTASAALAQTLSAAAVDETAPTDPVAVGLLQDIFFETRSSSTFEHYLKGGKFRAFSGPVDPDVDALASGSWGQIHGDAITGGVPGALYNASFAIDRADTPAAIAAITAAVADLAPSFVFTMRFVDHAAGTLAFTRFPHATVIEIDGLSPLVIGLFRARYEAGTDTPDPQILAGFDRLATTLERGAMAVRAALDAAGIDFSMHWGKLGNLDAAKVAADYRCGQIAAWQATRTKLIGARGASLFTNPAVQAYGLT